ncbi:MAG: hypothetical protein PUK05_02660 [Peptoniphilaceae bacterium]|nr:hypothetical protein [Peptoniphilaceae bacterium]
MADEPAIDQGSFFDWRQPLEHLHGKEIRLIQGPIPLHKQLLVAVEP